MAIQTEPTRIAIPFADSGTKNVIPDTNSTPSASQAASWTDGFPAQCSLPLSAGGIPPARADFNGVFNAITRSERFTEEGGVWGWDATVDYDIRRVVLGSDGRLYWSIAQSGPSFASGAVDPTSDNGTYWGSPSVKTMPYDDSSSAVANTAWCNSWFVNKVTLPANLYVDPAGDDSNDGFTATTPKKTIQGAQLLVASNKYICPSIVNIRLAGGSYTGGSNRILGDIKTQLSYSVSNGTAYISDSCYIADNTRVILNGNYSFGSGIAVAYSGQLQLANNCSITFDNISVGNSAFFYIYNGGIVFVRAGSSASIAFSGSCSGTVLQVAYGALVSNYGTLTWSGNVTGKKYSLYGNATVRGMGSNNIPGSTAGTVGDVSYFS